MESLKRLYGSLALILTGIVLLVILTILIVTTDFFGNQYLESSPWMGLYYFLVLMPFLFGAEHLLDHLLEDAPHHGSSYLGFGLLFLALYLWVSVPEQEWLSPTHLVLALIGLWSVFKSLRLIGSGRHSEGAMSTRR